LDIYSRTPERGYVKQLQVFTVFRSPRAAGQRTRIIFVRSIFCAVFQQEQADEWHSGILCLKEVGAQPRLNGLRTRF
jgi:hypothetical protein